MTVNSILKYIIITFAGIVLYTWAAEYAYAERGYAAYGGEYLLLLLPAFWWICEKTVKDTKKDKRKLPLERGDNRKGQS